MNIKRTALLLVLWTISSQVVALAGAHQLLNAAADSTSHQICHDYNDSGVGSSAADGLSLQTNVKDLSALDSPTEQCCEHHCFCSIGGCSSIPSTASSLFPIMDIISWQYVSYRHFSSVKLDDLLRPPILPKS